MIHTSFFQDFGPFIIDVIKLDLVQATFEFLTHLIEILQPLNRIKGVNRWFQSFLFMNGFQDGYHPEFFPVMLGYLFFEFLPFPFKGLGLFGYSIDGHVFGMTHRERMKKFRNAVSIYINSVVAIFFNQFARWSG